MTTPPKRPLAERLAEDVIARIPARLGGRAAHISGTAEILRPPCEALALAREALDKGCRTAHSCSECYADGLAASRALAAIEKLELPR